jgi:hypothetical protein
MLVLFIFTISPLVISLSTAQVGGGGGVIVLFCRMFEHISFVSSTVKGSEIRNLTFFSCVQYMLDTTSLLMADDRYFTYKHSFTSKHFRNGMGFLILLLGAVGIIVSSFRFRTGLNPESELGVHNLTSSVK